MALLMMAAQPAADPDGGCPEHPPCHGCGCGGGPGYRGPNGHCVGFRALDRVCGIPPTEHCIFENAPGTGANAGCAMRGRHARPKRHQDVPGSMLRHRPLRGPTGSARARSLWGDLKAEIGDPGGGTGVPAEGLQVLTPVFAAYPVAVRDVMVGLARSHPIGFDSLKPNRTNTTSPSGDNRSINVSGNATPRSYPSGGHGALDG
jgi:hypothetical protein